MGEMENEIKGLKLLIEDMKRDKEERERQNKRVNDIN